MKRTWLVFLAALLLVFPAQAQGKKKRKKRKKTKTKQLFRVRDGRDCGYVDPKGKLVVPLQYTNAYPYSEGLARVTGRYPGFLDTSGKPVIGVVREGPGRRYTDFAEGLAGFEDKRGKWGFIDASGKVVIQPKWKGARAFSEGRAVVQVEHSDSWGIGKRGYIDKKGKLVIEPRYNEALDFSQGLGAVNLKGVHGQWGYVDKRGKMRIKPRFHRAWRFSSGLARALEKPADGWGYIDKRGRWVIGPGLSAPNNANGGLVPVHMGGWKIFSSRGKQLTDKLPYFSVDQFSEGLAVVEITNDGKKLGKFGYMDKRGRLKIKAKFDWAERFKNGRALAKIGKTEVLIDTKGRIVWRPKKQR